MYLTFYGLTERPFGTTPDPRFLYFSPGHREALASLLYGIQERVGFLQLTGEVGTGKTTLLHALLERLDGTAAVSFIVNSALPIDGVLETVLSDFGIREPVETRAQRLLALRRFLIERAQADQKTILIVDEAHHLEPATLEQIRLLSNFETTTEKLLQIVLVGQPELIASLALPELRQLRQRISLRATLPPLSSAETRDYIRTRLRTVGSRDTGLFTEQAVTRIAKYAGGIPRLINLVCDHCLVIGYGQQRRRLDEDIVTDAIRYLEEGAGTAGAGGSHRGGRRWLPRPFAWAALTPVVLGLAAVPLLGWRALESVSLRAAELFHNLAQSARDLLGP
jgi:general secretion pathway protein A